MGGSAVDGVRKHCSVKPLRDLFSLGGASLHVQEICLKPAFVKSGFVVQLTYRIRHVSSGNLTGKDLF